MTDVARHAALDLDRADGLALADGLVGERHGELGGLRVELLDDLRRGQCEPPCFRRQPVQRLKRFK